MAQAEVEERQRRRDYDGIAPEFWDYWDSIKNFRRLRLMELFQAGIILLWGRPFVSSLALNHVSYQRKNSHGLAKEVLV